MLCSCNVCISNLQVCTAAVGLMGDLCRALGVKVLPYCDETMVMLLENLGVCMNACTVSDVVLEARPWPRDLKARPWPWH